MQAKIGDTITRSDGRRFKLAGILNDGWVANDLDGFASPVFLSAAELATGFGVDSVEQPETETQTLIRRDREATDETAGLYFGRKPSKPQLLPPEGSPERLFTERAAQDIYRDADRLAEYELAEVDVSPAVAALLDDLIAARNSVEPVEPKAKPRRRRS